MSDHETTLRAYIRMPDADCPDPAHRTLPLLRDALAALSPRETAPGGGR